MPITASSTTVAAPHHMTATWTFSDRPDARLPLSVIVAFTTFAPEAAEPRYLASAYEPAARDRKNGRDRL
jgi:hypothetical protein